MHFRQSADFHVKNKMSPQPKPQGHIIQLSDGVNLVGLVSMVSVDAYLSVTALLEELRSNLREHCVSEHILNGSVLNVLLDLFLHCVELGLEKVGRAAGDGLLCAEDLLLELRIDCDRSLAVFALNETLELLGNSLVALACNYVEHSLSTNDL